MKLKASRIGDTLLVNIEGKPPMRRHLTVGVIVGDRKGRRRRTFVWHRLFSAPPAPPPGV